MKDIYQKPLCPFGNILIAFQRNHLKSKAPIYIYVGQNAKIAAISELELGTLATYLPYNVDFQRFEWPIKNKNVVVIEYGNSIKRAIFKFCLHLKQSKPNVIYLHSESFGNYFFQGDSNE